MSEGPNSAQAAVALRLAGASYSEIAETLAYDSEEKARAAVERDLAARAADADPAKRELLRAQSAARLERLLRSVWGKAVDPNNAEQLPAVTKALTIIDRYSRLYGLDAPTEVTVYTPTTSEIDEWVAKVVGSGAVLDVVEADILEIEAAVDEPA